jgi:hypothetical protein
VEVCFEDIFRASMPEKSMCRLGMRRVIFPEDKTIGPGAALYIWRVA